MTANPYDYSQRESLFPISWQTFHGLCKGLVAAVSSYDPEFILAIGRGGFYPGTLMAHILRVELHPVRLSRRVKDIVTYDHPRWITRPPEEVRGVRVLLVDEICDSGETLTICVKAIQEMGALSVRTAVLYAHTWGADIPDYIGIITDALILNPWDREIWSQGGFQFHPEYAAALAQQGLEASPSLQIEAPIIPPTKVPTRE